MDGRGITRPAQTQCSGQPAPQGAGERNGVRKVGETRPGGRSLHPCFTPGAGPLAVFAAA